MRLFGILVATICLATATIAQAQPAPLLLAPFVVGSSAYSVRELSSDIAVTVGKPVTTTLLDALRAAIRARYLRDGYISPIITVPDEDTASATPRVYIFEAKIAGVSIKGDPGPYRDRIEADLRLLESGPLRKEALRETLRLVARLPGLVSHPTLEPQPGFPNQFVLVLDLTYRRVLGELDLNNGGTRALGRVLYGGNLVLNDALGAEEQLQLRAGTTSQPDRYHYEDGKVLRSFGATEVFLEVARTDAKPDQNLHFSNENVTIGLSRPIVERSGGTVKLVGWLQADDSMIRNAGNVILLDDRGRSAALGFNFEGTGSKSQTSLYSTLDRGTGALHASTLDAHSSEVEIAFTKYLFGFSQSVAFAPLWTARLNVDVQASPDVLPVAERFAFGGLGVGEAFDPASLVGDSGATASAQLGRALRLPMKAMLAATAYVRADYGIAWSNASYLPRKDDATSLNVGVLGKWPHAVGTIDLSTPLHQPVYAQPASDWRCLFSVALTF